MGTSCGLNKLVILSVGKEHASLSFESLTKELCCVLCCCLSNLDFGQIRRSSTSSSLYSTNPSLPMYFHPLAITVPDSCTVIAWQICFLADLVLFSFLMKEKRILMIQAVGIAKTCYF